MFGSIMAEVMNPGRLGEMDSPFPMPKEEGREQHPIILALEKIDNLDFSMVKMKLCLSVEQEGNGWTPEFADKAEEHYKMFLKLHILCPHAVIAPTTSIDEFWHRHILDTRKYQEDCQNVFGSYLHHFPYFGLRGEEDAKNLQKAGETTRALFMEHFGVKISSQEKNGDCTFCQCCGTK